MTSAATASAQRVSVPAKSSAGPLPDNLRSALNAALLANNAVPTILTSLLDECQRSGFTAAIRARVADLLRSGECTTYGEVMREVMGEIKSSSDVASSNVAATSNGEDLGPDGERKLKVPKRVIEEGVKQVRAALETCVDIVNDE